MNSKFDVVVVGGGPGGYVAAIRAAQLGLSTALVEKQHLGGICLNWGCIPTKALLKGAEVAHTLAHAADFGFELSQIQFDIQKLVKHSRDVSARLRDGIGFLLKKNKVTVFEGFARLTDVGKLSVSGEQGEKALSASHIILATGARPRSLPGISPDGKRVWSYFEAMVPESLPKSLLVIGSGAIGVEFASLYRSLGSEVTLVEVQEQVMPTEDAEVSALAERRFRQQGMDVRTATKVTELTRHDDSVTCTLESNQGESETMAVERVILAAGIQGNIEDIGLESLGVATEGSFIRTDDWCQTNVVGLYAIGDVAGPPCLAHKASHEAIICVEKLAGVSGVHPLDKNRVPGCTYCTPQVASVGMTEADAKAAGRAVKVGRFHLQGNGKALAIADSEGFVKTLFDADTGELLGAHMIGPEVTEQIQGFGIAQALEATEAELIHTVFAHPTLSEAMHESVLDAMNRAIHQ